MRTEKIYISSYKLDYKCPNCNKQYNDENDELCERLNNSKKGYLTLKCDSCKAKFGYTVDMTGQSVGFEL